MKLYLKIFALILALFACFAVSCNKGDAEEPTDEATDGFFEENRTYMLIDADVKILCTQEWSKEIKSYCERIAGAIKEKTGLELEIVYESGDAGKEIVVGYFNNHASANEAYETISIDQYAVYVNDRSAVVAAYEYEKLGDAANAFVEHSIVKEGEEWKIGSISPKGDGKKCSTSITAYRIVYSANAESYIVEDIVPMLQELIKNKAKVEIEAVSDAEPATEREIVVGNTNRSTDTIKRCYEGSSAYESYRAAIIPEGDRLFLVGGDRASFGVAVANLEKYITYGDYGPKLLDLDAKKYATSKMMTDATRELADGADVRIMSYNVLNPVWGKDANKSLNPVESRINKFIDLALYYRPDVIGLQEASYDWHKYLDKMLVSTGVYSFCCNRSNGSAENMTGFIYNPATVRVIESYVIDLVEKSDHRVISVGVFETLKDERRFVVMNTHPVPSNYESYSEQMAQIIELEKQEMEKYSDLPIFLTGDFNTDTKKPEYTAFTQTLNVTNSRDSADVILNHNTSYAGFKKPSVCDGTKCIDHIFHNENADTKFFNTVVDDDMYLGSDHMPIYADVTLLQS